MSTQIMLVMWYPSRSTWQVPPPLTQRFFSGSRAHEKAVVTRVSLRESAGGATVGGRQVALVKKSTSLRTKIRGKVPPRLQTLD